jgi:hypothetical protein
MALLVASTLQATGRLARGCSRPATAPSNRSMVLFGIQPGASNHPVSRPAAERPIRWAAQQVSFRSVGERGDPGLSGLGTTGMALGRTRDSWRCRGSRALPVRNQTVASSHASPAGSEDRRSHTWLPCEPVGSVPASCVPSSSWRQAGPFVQLQFQRRDRASRAYAA